MMRAAKPNVIKCGLFDLTLEMSINVKNLFYSVSRKSDYLIKLFLVFADFKVILRRLEFIEKRVEMRLRSEKLPSYVNEVNKRTN